MWPRFAASKPPRRAYRNHGFVSDQLEGEADTAGRSPGLSRMVSETIRRDDIFKEKYRIFVSTWNAGGVAPPEDLSLEDWLDTSHNPCDIYVLGFQEIVPLNAGNVFGPENVRVSSKWNALIRASLNKIPSIEIAGKLPEKEKPGEKQKVYPVKDQDSGLFSAGKFDGKRPEFQCVVSKQMVGIFITVWVRSDLRRHVRNASVSCVGCGIMGIFGNKGSVSVRFHLHQTSFCFVCTHLASGGKEGDEIHRNSDASEILSRTSFTPSSNPNLPKKILEHDRIVWLGDLNYRISLTDSETRLLVERGDWKSLHENDQLRVEMGEGRVFEGWKEGRIDFAPTYKYYPFSDSYFGSNSKMGEKRRAPAWCDRILWYGEGLEQKGYERGESRLSDHRPVRATFMADVEVSGGRKALESLFLSLRYERVPSM
ncbi:hypothetical protein AMTRI_Chr04g244180 [Amborella trichopoda]